MSDNNEKRPFDTGKRDILEVCEMCGSNKNTIVLRQCIGQKKRILRICQKCASILGIESGGGIKPQIGDLLVAVLDPGGVGPRDSATCNGCGTSYGEIRRLGIVGCSDCYDVFAQEIRGILRRVSQHSSHRGKLPRRLRGVKILLQEKPELEKKLLDALQSEDYEGAVDLRDKIHRIETVQDGELPGEGDDQ